MIREVNLIGHLPSFIQEYREMQSIMAAENPELQSVEDDSETIKNNMFVLLTNEVGIERYEKMFRLTPSKKDSLSDRQAKVLARYTNTVIYTLRGLIERLNIVCGVDNYSLEMIPDEYKINIYLHVRVGNLINTISSMLADMIPANVLCTYIVNGNTHGVLANYPTYLLAQFTHHELHNESIENNISARVDNLANYTVEDIELITCENISTFGKDRIGGLCKRV